MNGDPKLYELLKQLDIPFDYYEHPPIPTVEEAKRYWKDIEARHCKNLFFRNHKGNRHYLVVLEHQRQVDIRSMEQLLKQGKLSFASNERLFKHLGVLPGSVTPLGLMNDTEKHVKLFLDEHLKSSERISFHPCDNTASIVVSYADFIRFLENWGGEYEYVRLYEE